MIKKDEEKEQEEGVMTPEEIGELDELKKKIPQKFYDVVALARKESLDYDNTLEQRVHEALKILVDEGIPKYSAALIVYQHFGEFRHRSTIRRYLPNDDYKDKLQVEKAKKSNLAQTPARQKRKREKTVEAIKDQIEEIRNNKEIPVKEKEELFNKAGIKYDVEKESFQYNVSDFSGIGELPLHGPNWKELLLLQREGESVAYLMFEHGKLTQVSGNIQFEEQVREKQMASSLGR
jgi:hypothetical protein